MSGEVGEKTGLSEFEAQVIGFFCDGVKMLGLPKSIGEIYGLLYVTQEALSLDDLVSRLGISKGSTSQGLKMLRKLGAVREVEGELGRRVYYEPDVELKQLVGGFIKEQAASGKFMVRARKRKIPTNEQEVTVETLESGKARLRKLEKATVPLADVPETLCFR
ncbi:hypothetical protein OAF68_03190 [Akkermansiaceae bacterium]|nr:hypothetical protein [Akkermansiaceae bacterium]